MLSMQAHLEKEGNPMGEGNGYHTRPALDHLSSTDVLIEDDNGVSLFAMLHQESLPTITSGQFVSSTARLNIEKRIQFGAQKFLEVSKNLSRFLVTHSRSARRRHWIPTYPRFQQSLVHRCEQRSWLSSLHRIRRFGT
jgi:hypothetical protein